MGEVFRHTSPHPHPSPPLEGEGVLQQLSFVAGILFFRVFASYCLRQYPCENHFVIFVDICFYGFKFWRMTLLQPNFSMIGFCA
jgi:hypothetical protein